MTPEVKWQPVSQKPLQFARTGEQYSRPAIYNSKETLKDQSSQYLASNKKKPRDSPKKKVVKTENKAAGTSVRADSKTSGVPPSAQHKDKWTNEHHAPWKSSERDYSLLGDLVDTGESPLDDHLAHTYQGLAQRTSDSVNNKQSQFFNAAKTFDTNDSEDSRVARNAAKELRSSSAMAPSNATQPVPLNQQSQDS